MEGENIYEQAAGARQKMSGAPEAARDDGQDDALVPGHEADDSTLEVVLPLEVDEIPALEPVARAGDDGQEPTDQQIRTGPGMAPETARAIREQQRLEYDALKTGFTAQGVALAQLYIEEAVTPALSGQFLQERVVEKRRVGSGAYPLTEGSSETGRPAELPDARLQAVRNSLVSLNEGTRGITPPGRIAEAQRLMTEELRQQQEYRRGRTMLLDVEKQARQQIQIALKEAGTTLFGKEGRLVRRMKGLRSCLRNLGNPDEIRREVDQLKTLRNHKLAKNGKAVDAEIARLEGRLQAHESIDGFLAQKDLDPYLRFAIESRIKGRPVDYGDLSNPANALYQKVYEGTVDFLLGSARPSGEVSSPAARVPGTIPAPERAVGQEPQAVREAELEESSVDDPVNKLRISAKRNQETAQLQAGLRQAMREGQGDPVKAAAQWIEDVRTGVNPDDAIRTAQQLVADTLDDMKTMSTEELKKTLTWLVRFVGALNDSVDARNFKTGLMNEAIVQVFQILRA